MFSLLLHKANSILHSHGALCNVFVFLNLFQEVRALHEVTTQRGISSSSRPENVSVDVVSQAGRPEPTSPGTSHPVPEETVITTQANAHSETPGSANSKNKQPTPADEPLSQAGDTKPQPPTLELSNPHVLDSRRESWSTSRPPSQSAQPSVATKENSRSSHKVEKSISSPTVHSERPTASSVSPETAGTQSSASNGPKDSRISTRPTLTPGPTTHSEFITSSFFPSSDRGVTEVRQEAEESLDSQTDPTLSWTVSPPTTMNADRKMKNVSAGERKEKEEVEQSLETVPPETLRPQQPGGDQGSGAEAEEDEMDSGLEEEEEGQEMEESDDDEDATQPSPDWTSDPETEAALLSVAANQTPAYKVRLQGAGLSQGSRGERVRVCLHSVKPVGSYSETTKLLEVVLF